MKKLVSILLVGMATFLPTNGAFADHYYDGECRSQESCSDYDYEHNNSEGRNRGAFSPGPFDDSPVDIRDNNICISPDCSQRDGGEKK